ncbi:TPA: pyridoxamine 5-phosphate oxidase [Candidatus Gastranaerophilales bacterium HUM_2]|nr:MAG TPA: pyridoxamine 5-phosphate oxidase [Candidatus Gastranaerophilales bacterium HUM_2]
MKYELASSSWDEKEIEAIHRVIDSGFYTFGKHVAQFEKDFANFTNHKYSVMVNSGSSANLLAVAAMFYKKENPLQAGDEVIVPAVSWATTYYPLYQYGLKLKFVDTDINTLNFDLKQLEAAITDKTKMIFAVNLLGNPNDYDEIKRIIGNRNIYLLEDNCESLGGIYKGKQLGSIGLIGTYSTFFSHHMSTMEGGVVATDDEELNEIILCLRSHGWTRQLPKENKLCIKSDDYFTESWRFILPGYNVRPTEMNGAIGIEQIKKLPDFIKWRRINAKHFQELFSNDKRFIIQKEIGESSWFGFSLILTDDSVDRKKIIDKCTAASIDTRPIVAGNFARKEVVKYFNHEIFGDLKNADFIEKRGFFVGNHQYDIRKEIDYLKETLDKAL